MFKRIIPLLLLALVMMPLASLMPVQASAVVVEADYLTQDIIPLTPDDPLSSYNDNTYLEDIDINSAGFMVAAGRGYLQKIGGYDKRLYVLEKTPSASSWSAIPVPLVTGNSKVYQEFKAVTYIPNDPDNDFIAVGGYEPDPLTAAYSNGVIARYHHASQSWDIITVTVPNTRRDNKDLVHLRDITVDPLNPSRFIIVGHAAVNAGGGFPDYEPLIIEYKLTNQGQEAKPVPAPYTIVPVAKLSPTSEQINSVTALPNGTFVVSGTNYIDNTRAEPVILGMSATNKVAVQPNPPAVNSTVVFTGSAWLSDNQLMFVGFHAPNLGSNFSTLAYRYNLITKQWVLLNSLNPALTLPNQSYLNQFFGVTQSSDGSVYAAGRIIILATDGKYRYQGMVQRFNPTANIWELLTIPSSFAVDASQPVAGSFGSELYGVATDSSGKVFAAGWYLTDVASPNLDFNSALILKN